MLSILVGKMSQGPLVEEVKNAGYYRNVLYGDVASSPTHTSGGGRPYRMGSNTRKCEKIEKFHCVIENF